MRYFLSKSVPPFSRVLLVESGSRDLFEELLSGLYNHHPQMKADLVTCYAGVPKTFRTELGNVYRVTEYPDGRSRLGAIRHFVLFRAGLTGTGAVRALARLVLFPFTLLYLILYAATIHLRRKLRTL